MITAEECSAALPLKMLCGSFCCLGGTVTMKPSSIVCGYSDSSDNLPRDLAKVWLEIFS